MAWPLPARMMKYCTDNFDAQISSANGLNALALLLIQVKKDDPSYTNLSSSYFSIRRIKKEEMKDEIDKPVTTLQWTKETTHAC